MGNTAPHFPIFHPLPLFGEGKGEEGRKKDIAQKGLSLLVPNIDALGGDEKFVVVQDPLTHINGVGYTHDNRINGVRDRGNGDIIPYVS